jgi:hypothetical protein
MNIINKKTIQNILNLVTNKNIENLKKACEKRGFSSDTCSTIFEIGLCLAYYDGYNTAMSELRTKKKDDREVKKYAILDGDNFLVQIAELDSEQAKVFDFLYEICCSFDTRAIPIEDYKCTNVSKKY